MSFKKIFLTRPDFPENGVSFLQEKYFVECYPLARTISRDALLEGVRGKDALFCLSTDRIDKEVLEAAGDQLKVIATFSLGYEHIDIIECRKRGIVVCNGPNSISVGSVAEMTIGLMLAAGRRIVEGARAIERGHWVQTWDPEFYTGRGLIGATVGIVGMGRIGTAILKRVLPFDVSQVLYNDVYHPIQQAEDLGAKYASFEDLLEKSDYVIASCNLTDENKGIFDTDAFTRMKNTAIFVNTSRGAIVNQEALYDALLSKQIKAAALDVMYPEPLPKDHKLLSLPSIILLPHICGAEENGLKRLSELAAKNIDAVLEGKPTVTPSVA